MKISMRVFVSFILMVGLIWVAGCNKHNPAATSLLTKSSKVVMKATAFHTSTNTTLSSIPVVGGTLDVQTAWVNIVDLQIEENSGFDGDQEGGYNNGDQQGEHNDDEQGGSEYENEAPDITAPGPFSLEISSGQALIGLFDVYPGTFKKVDFKFSPGANDPFFGKTIVINGEFTSTAGVVTPFVLKSEFDQVIQTQIAGGGITVPANATVDINVVFDLAGWFSNVDFSVAQISNGQILIDLNNNTTLLNAFEANLAQNIELENEQD